MITFCSYFYKYLEIDILIYFVHPSAPSIILPLFRSTETWNNVSNLEIPMHHLSFTFHDRIAENQFVEWLYSQWIQNATYNRKNTFFFASQR